MKPREQKLKIQCNLKMPWLTGIADAYSIDEDEKTTSLYEIKASSDPDWKDNASVQVFCYALMCGKTWSRLHLFNPFRNEKVSYYFDSKSILSLRMSVIQDILIWNINCMMAKLYPDTKDNDKLNVENTLFLHLLKNEKGQVKQVSIINMLSPIKCEFVYNKYVSSGEKKTKNMEKIDRFACESSLSSEDIVKEVNTILKSEMNKNKVVYSFEDYSDIINSEFKTIRSEYDDINSVTEIIKILKYERKTEYGLDASDSFYCLILCISFLFLNKHFV
jgi:hypothetical protein